MKGQTIMKNRIMNGIGIAFHSIGFYASAAIIVRMLIAITVVGNIGARVRYDSTFGDGYTSLIMLLTGFLMYPKHTGLCASVSLSPNKRVITAAVSAIPLSAVFALFDIGMVKVYFSTVSGVNEELYWWAALSVRTDAFPEGAALLFVKLTLIYHIFFIVGYSVRHIIFTKPTVMVMWMLAFFLVIPSSGVAYLGIDRFFEEPLMVVLLALPLLAAYILSAPVIYGFSLILFSMCEDSTTAMVLIMIAWVGCIASSARLVRNYKYEIPKEKRKGAVL